MPYGFNGITFSNVISATIDGERDIQTAASPGVSGQAVYDLGDRGEVYVLTLFELTVLDEIQDTVRTIVDKMNDPGPHVLQWHNESFNAQFLRHKVGPYSRGAGQRRVELTLEFRKDIT